MKCHCGTNYLCETGTNTSLNYPVQANRVYPFADRTSPMGLKPYSSAQPSLLAFNISILTRPSIELQKTTEKRKKEGSNEINYTLSRYKKDKSLFVIDKISRF